MKWWHRITSRPPREHRFARVAPWLIIGPALGRDAYQSLIAQEGVTHIVDLREEASDSTEFMASQDIQWLRIPIEDRQAPTVDQLTLLDQWIEPCIRGEGVVYLHCQGGLERSPTVAIALLMRQGLTLAESYRLVTVTRPMSRPTEAQQGWLTELSRSDAASPDLPQ
jgi:protein-tyrosine phosphatase